MAKGKHSTALFEVIAKGNLPRRERAATNSNPENPTPAAPNSLATPKWWFKSRTRNEVKTMAPGQTTATPAPSPKFVDEPVNNPATPVAAPQFHSSSVDHSASRDSASLAQDASDGNASTDTTSGGLRPQPLSLSMDPERQQINLRLSYTSALIGGFGLIVVIGVAVLIGKTLSRGPAPAIAGPSTPQLRQGPVNSGVLNLTRKPENAGGNSTGTQGTQARPSAGGGNSTSTGTRTTTPRNAANEPSPPTTFFTDDVRRASGLNYVIIQSYPDRETADKAADFLTKHGIACTVEKGLPAWPLPWADGCAVVGIRGFNRITNNPEADGYLSSINQASTQFAGNRGFKAFQPQFYKWRKGQ